MIPIGDAAREVIATIGRGLHEAGYWRESDERRHDGYIALMGAFRRMAEDAEKQRKRPTTADGREAALAFLKATVEDATKHMHERTEAARTLLMHSAEAK